MPWPHCSPEFRSQSCSRQTKPQTSNEVDETSHAGSQAACDPRNGGRLQPWPELALTLVSGSEVPATSGHTRVVLVAAAASYLTKLCAQLAGTNPATSPGLSRAPSAIGVSHVGSRGPTLGPCSAASLRPWRGMAAKQSSGTQLASTWDAS